MHISGRYRERRRDLLFAVPDVSEGAKEGDGDCEVGIEAIT